MTLTLSFSNWTGDSAGGEGDGGEEGACQAGRLSHQASPCGCSAMEDFGAKVSVTATPAFCSAGGPNQFVMTFAVWLLLSVLLFVHCGCCCCYYCEQMYVSGHSTVYISM